MANPWITVYEVPKSPYGSHLGVLRRGICSQCPEGDCATFVSDQSNLSKCLCPHQWHQHQPLWLEGGLDEIPSNVSQIFRAGGRPANGCTSYFPGNWPPIASTPCVCGESLNKHGLRPRVPGPAAISLTHPPVLGHTPIAVPAPASRTAVVQPVRARATSIQDLPNELMLEIFMSYIRGKDAPQRLMRVCRRWCDLVRGSPTLVDKILLTDVAEFGNLGGYAKEMSHGRCRRDLENSVICRNGESLVRAIERTRESKFDLSILLLNPSSCDADFERRWSTIRASIGQRCRTIRFLYSISHFPVQLIDNLTALENLDIHLPAYHASLDRLMDIVDTTSTQLRALSFKSRSLHTLARFSRTFSRLHSFIFEANNSGDITFDFNTATQLKILKICVTTPSRTASLSSTLPLLEQLAITNPRDGMIQLELYTRLTDLSLIINQVEDRLANDCQLQSLKRLTLSDSWSDIYRFKAPNLDTLTLRGGHINFEPLITALQGSSLKPRRLEVDLKRDGLSETDLRKLLLERWNHVEELRIVYIGEGNQLSNSLTIGFLGMKGHDHKHQDQLLPHLQVMMMRCARPNRSLRKRELQRKAVTELRMKQIFDSRATAWNLRRFDLGWYHDRGLGCPIEDDENCSWSLFLSDNGLEPLNLLE